MKANNINKLSNALFIIYLIVLFWIVVLKFSVSFSYGELRSVNLIPYSGPLNGQLDLGELIMNVLIFIPLGVYAGVLFKNWSLGKKLLLFILTSILCEGFQYLLALGAADSTDIINNTLGALIGLMLYKGIEKAFGNSVKAQEFVNIVAAIGTFSMVLLLFLLKMDALWILGIDLKYR